MDVTEIIWRPDPAAAARTRIARFMAAQGYRLAGRAAAPVVEDPEWYWDAVVRDLGLRLEHALPTVLDDSRGIMWPSWFEGGASTWPSNCVDRHVDAGRGEQARGGLGVRERGGRARSPTPRWRARSTASPMRCAGSGSASGDTVGIFLPMSPRR